MLPPHFMAGVAIGFLFYVYYVYKSSTPVAYIDDNNENPSNYGHPICGICGSEVRNQYARQFSCHHIFHSRCLSERGQCPTCG
uniref:RING-type domain-containing protein n=1 Tax=Glossina palpalis gambiensis TaxID=67801 RepID=A0A1B0AVK3_9MUSC